MNSNEEHCGACNKNLQGEEIPEEQQSLYRATHFSNKIGIEDPSLYDGVLWWRCPFCGYTWSRFSDERNQPKVTKEGSA